MQATMIAGALGMLTAWSSPHAPAPLMHTAHAAMACPAAKSDAHRALLKQADAEVAAGEDDKAARTFVAAYDGMDLADQVGNTGKFAADRAVTSFLKAWRIKKDVGLLDEAERFLLRYQQELELGRTEGCGVVDKAWSDEKLAEVRAERPQTETPTDPAIGPKPAPKDCPTAPVVIGVDRAGVALVTVGSSLFVTGTALLVVGLVQLDDDRTTANALAITGGILMGGSLGLIIPGAVRLGSWKRKQSQVRLGVAPWTGRGLAGVSVSGRFGARR